MGFFLLDFLLLTVNVPYEASFLRNAYRDGTHVVKVS